MRQSSLSVHVRLSQLGPCSSSVERKPPIWRKRSLIRSGLAAYANTSPIEPRDLIDLWPTRQQAADAIGEPIEIINGWISRTVVWDHAVIRRLHERIDQAAPFRRGIVSVRAALENAPVD